MGGRIRVPCNQVLTPCGTRIDFAGRPADVALSEDGKTIAVLSFQEIVILDRESRTVRQRLKSAGPRGFSFHGIAFHDGKIWASSLNGRIDILAPGPEGWAFADPIDLGGVPGGFAFSADGSRLYVAGNTKNELMEVDPAAGTVLRRIPVGVAPYDVAVAGGRAYVSNWGGRPPGVKDPAGPGGAGSAVRVDPVRNIASEGSVSVIDLAAWASAAEIPVGPHAAGLVLSPDGSLLYVACANADRVAVIDTTALAVADEIDVRPHPGLLFGSAPNALALSPDGNRLFVSNGTNNAVAVVDIAGNDKLWEGPPGPDQRPGSGPGGPSHSRMVGFLPTAWYPAGLVHDAKRNEVIVANLKGTGSWDRRRKPAEGWNSHDYLGSVSIIPLPPDDTLPALTRRVLENNRLTESLDALLPPRPGVPPRPVPERIGEPSVFEHVIYVIKENRTYDQVLGDLPGGDGDPKLCLFGEAVTPNHHALAREFALLDRFFCSGVISADGHQWTDEAYVVDYIEKFFGGWVRSYPFPGGDALAYSAGGFLWDNALARGRTFRDYGEFMDAKIRFRDGSSAKPTFLDCWEDYRNGGKKIEIRAVPNLATLEPYHCPTSIGFPLIVSDQHRVDQFLNELKGFETSGGFPNLSIVFLPNDHTMGAVPGAATPRAAVADNDLALGRLVEAVSRSRFWPTTCILVTEDDPQAGFDHVDGRRTVGFAISPYTRRKKVVRTEYNQTSLVRTIEQILGLPPMNQIDAAAAPMRDCFTDRPDFTPYTARPANIPLDELNARIEDIRDPDQRRWALASMELPLDEPDEADEDTFNRILWHTVKGGDARYPEEFTRTDGDEDNQ